MKKLGKNYILGKGKIEVGDLFYNKVNKTIQTCIGVDSDTIYSEGRNDSIWNEKEKCIKVIKP